MMCASDITPASSSAVDRENAERVGGAAAGIGPSRGGGRGEAGDAEPDARRQFAATTTRQTPTTPARLPTMFAMCPASGGSAAISRPMRSATSDEQRDHRQENDRQEQRALDDDDRLFGPTRKIDAPGGRRRRRFEPDTKTPTTSANKINGKSRTTAARAPARKRPRPIPRKLPEQDEVLEERQEQDVRRHPADERNFKE